MAIMHNDSDTSQNDNAQVHALQKQLEACQAERDDFKDKFLRVTADLQNFRRRTEKEQMMWMQTAQSEILLNLLPIVDDMDRALNESSKAGSSSEIAPWIAGLQMINQSLHKFLNKSGVEEITQLTTFDPNLHEAIASVDVPDKQSGSILEVLQKGFMFKGNVLRPAKVAVVK
jgi:molecular chaperone GrpE